jgi:hypothetical protein
LTAEEEQKEVVPVSDVPPASEEQKEVVPVADVPPASEEQKEAAPVVEVSAVSEDQFAELNARFERLEANVSGILEGITGPVTELIQQEVQAQLLEMEKRAPAKNFYDVSPEVIRVFDAIQRFGTPEPQPPHSSEDLTELRAMIEKVEMEIGSQVNELVARIERKPETGLMERMFEKLRSLVAGFKDDLAAIERKMTELVTRADMEDYVEANMSSIIRDDETAAAEKPLKCLACGKPRLKTSTAESHTFTVHRLPALTPTSKSKKRPEIECRKSPE